MNAVAHLEGVTRSITMSAAARFLAEWLSRHILHADRRFAQFLLASDDRSTQDREAASRIR